MQIKGKIVFPNTDILASKTTEEINKLKITKFEWFENGIWACGLTLSDGTSGKCEGPYKINKSFTLHNSKHVSRVEVIFHGNE